MKKIVLTSVYCNPIHPGHIECFELAKELGDELWVIVNNDIQAELKRGVTSFQDENFRLSIVKALRSVDLALLSIDTDSTVVDSIASTFHIIKEKYGADAQIIFAKGGDRFADEIPEKLICDQLGITIIDSLGAKTHNSSQYVTLTTENN
jgi:cytidyltransferase-like protein